LGFNKAAATFRAAFIDEIYALRRSERYGDKDPNSILTEPIFAAHEKAKIMFEPFLSTDELKRFSVAWDNYRNHEIHYCKGNGPFNIGTADTNKEMSKFCLTHLNTLLQFSEPKVST
jgi:hypothetical protein